MSEVTAALKTDGLTLSFGRNAVIRGLDLFVPQGSIYGFLGRNGAGKTTTLRMVLGLLRADDGRALVDTLHREALAMDVPRLYLQPRWMDLIDPGH